MSDLFTIQETPCLISGDPVPVAQALDTNDTTEAISADSLKAIVWLYAMPELEWIKVARVRIPGDIDIQLVVRSDDHKFIEQLEKHGHDVRHGDIYEADQAQVGTDSNDQQNTTISGAISRRVYKGSIEKIERSTLEHPTVATWLDNMREHIDQLIKERPQDLPKPFSLDSANEPDLRSTPDTAGQKRQGDNDSSGISRDSNVSNR